MNADKHRFFYADTPVTKSPGVIFNQLKVGLNGEIQDVFRNPDVVQESSVFEEPQK